MFGFVFVVDRLSLQSTALVRLMNFQEIDVSLKKGYVAIATISTSYLYCKIPLYTLKSLF